MYLYIRICNVFDYYMHKYILYINYKELYLIWGILHLI